MLSQFRDLVEERKFHEVPDNWFVVITDVKGSTRAIESGRYKDVNMIGAAAISCVQNVFGDEEFPFVFGGDGATILVPDDKLELISDALVTLQKVSIENFGLELRVGAVCISEVHTAGASIKVAKHHLVGKKGVALFMGGGLSIAEDLVKSDPEKYQLKGRTNSASCDLDGLSCRWEAVPSKKGVVLSLLVVANTGDHKETYTRVLTSLEKILAGEIDSANPMNIEKMAYKSFLTSIKDEIRYEISLFSTSFLIRFMKIALSTLAFRLNLPILGVSSTDYKQAINTHSDYKKFDDALRMVLDCTEDQAQQIEHYLECEHEQHSLSYGTHRSTSSLMTCYVRSLDDGHHIHFVDGGDGGYAMASKGLKAQLKKKTSK